MTEAIIPRIVYIEFVDGITNCINIFIRPDRVYSSNRTRRLRAGKDRLLNHFHIPLAIQSTWYLKGISGLFSADTSFCRNRESVSCPIASLVSGTGRRASFDIIFLCRRADLDLAGFLP